MSRASYRCTLALALVAVSEGARAQVSSGALVEVTGRVTVGTCHATISEDGVTPGSANASIRLTQVDARDLNQVGKSAGQRSFHVLLQGCSAGTVEPFFEHGANVTASGRLANRATSGAAANVDLEMLNRDGNAMDLGAARGMQNALEFNVADGSGSIRYAIRYHATGLASPGVVRSEVLWGFDYK